MHLERRTKPGKAVGASAAVKHTEEAAILESMRDRRWTLEQALAVLAVQASSGLSVHTFAAKHDLTPSGFTTGGGA